MPHNYVFRLTMLAKCRDYLITRFPALRYNAAYRRMMDYLRIPAESVHPFQGYPSTDSDLIRPPVPKLSVHFFSDVGMVDEFPGMVDGLPGTLFRSEYTVGYSTGIVYPATILTLEAG